MKNRKIEKLYSTKKICALVFICFLFLANRVQAADKFFYWVDDPSNEIGDVSTSTGFNTPMSGFTKIEDCTASLATVDHSHTTSNGCYQGGQVKITSFSPTSGKVGDKITITGNNLLIPIGNKIGKILFGTKEASFIYPNLTDKTTIIAEVPSGVISGKITIITPTRGTAVSANIFTVINPADTKWWYKNIQKQHMGPFDTEATCNISRTSYITDPNLGITPDAIGPCFQQTLTDANTEIHTYEGLFAPPVNIAPDEQQQKGYSDVYTLLAPIGSFKCISTTGADAKGTANACATNGIGDYLNIIFLIAIGLAGVLSVVMIVIGGIQYMGNESVFGKTEAKGRIWSAIIGLLIALGAWALLYTINPDLTGLNGVNVDQVTASIDPEVETAPITEYSSGGDTKNCTAGFVDIATYGNPGKINVCKIIAPGLTNMLLAAKNSGIILSGYGSRSTATQKQLRIQHGCPDDNTPANQCHPPTARPGHSMHERGLAVDFTCNGRSMEAAGGRASSCYTWLTQNGNKFGFINLPSESWHWSINGR